MLTSVATLCASLTLMAAPANEPAAAEPEMHAIETQIIERTNAERARYKLRPLILDRVLLFSARRHAAWMTNNHTMQHSQGVAENIAMGQRNTTEVMQSWMNSSGHRANILSTGYSRIGVAAYKTPQGTIYWCQQFRP